MGGSQSKSAAPSKEPARFKVGDRVAVTMDVENFRLLQNDHGGWEAQMSLVFGNVGIVQRLLPSGGLMVHYKVANATWQLNPAAVEKLIAYKTGDKVRVCVKLETLKELQKGHGGYNDRMQMTAPVLRKVHESSGDSNDVLSGGIGGLLRLALEESIADLVQRARRRSLQESPLHTACFHGNEEVARALICAGNDVNARDKDGATPLHYCAYGNQPDAMRLLANAGADLNAVN
ncbi:E3 ubiquitin-protein ligase mind-bomb-like isoform X1 [Dermacentor silvarum]|uniref:E3 ubiquitin-protein ligase mind-bomb-like isoform X1 n=1 Tax=Dermacentor silvarum TaxID=543639 RepID=UPI00210155A1|nr:E3 ubiquitin-protein ligase mind-bomb-like isoform X1 [Dermacentor silvarum]